MGPAALDLVHNGQTAGNPVLDEERYAKAILAISVLSVVISAPIGAILIALTGPRLLFRDCKYNLLNYNFFPTFILY